MPEMPAKESAPEFGFRDASPAVAAAALAALKSGNGAARTSRGGRPARRPAEPPTESSEIEAPTAAIAIDDGSPTEAGEVRRRRRRRGGRGRGRGRGREGSADEGVAQAAASEAAPEVGWQEFDDLSQLEGLEEEREYTFEEADPQTLAELGLLDEPTISEPAADTAVEPEAKVARPRGRGRTASTARAGASASTSEEPKPRRRRAAAPKEPTADGSAEVPKTRRRTRAAATPAAKAEPAVAPDQEAAAKPRRRTRSTPPADETAASSSEEQPQGIWQRFRSARENTPGS